MSGAVPALALHGVTRTFRQGRRTVVERITRRPDLRAVVAAVDGLDLRVEQAEIFGLLGPNGAGKSTTVRMIATLLRPTTGRVLVNGVDAVADPISARRQLGVVLGGERSLYWKLTGRDNLRYFGALQDVPRRQLADRISTVLAGADLLDRADDYVERYSTGMRQRLAIARALLARPPVLVLDEPTSGLDPQSAAHLRDLVRRLRSEGHTILLTTHDMAEAEQVCDRVAIVDHGRVVALGTVPQLRARVATGRTARIEVVAGSADESELLHRIGCFATIVDKRVGDGVLRLVLHVDDAVDLLPALVQAARASGDAQVSRVEVEPVGLADIFLALTGRELRE